MKKYSFYSVFGGDNFGVFDDYALAIQAAVKVNHGKVKGFEDYYDALDYALEQYIWLHLMCTGRVAPLFNETGTITLNELVFRRLYRLVC